MDPDPSSGLSVAVVPTASISPSPTRPQPPKTSISVSTISDSIPSSAPLHPHSPSSNPPPHPHHRPTISFKDQLDKCAQDYPDLVATDIESPFASPRSRTLTHSQHTRQQSATDFDIDAGISSHVFIATNGTGESHSGDRHRAKRVLTSIIPGARDDDHVYQRAQYMTCGWDTMQVCPTEFEPNFVKDPKAIYDTCTVNFQLNFVHKPTTSGVDHLPNLKNVAHHYFRYHSRNHLFYMRFAYLLLFTINIYLTITDITYDIGNLGIALTCLIAPPLVAWILSLAFTYRYLRIWQCINVMVFLCMSGEIIHAHWNKSHIQESTSAMVSMTGEVVLLLSLPSMLFKLPFYWCFALMSTVVTWFFIVIKVVHDVDEIIIRGMLEPLLISYVLFLYIAYQYEYRNRIAFLDSLDKLGRVRWTKRQFDVIKQMTNLGANDEDGGTTTQTNMMLRTGGLSEILGMVQSNDEEIRDAATTALEQFVKAMEHTPDNERDVHVALAAVKNIKRWVDRIKQSELTAEKRALHKINVFLGGSCNPTTWRHDTAIPLLEKAGISYYNPQVDNWSEELVAIETKVKEEANILLFVIDQETRALASIVEATEYMCSGRHVVLVINRVPDNARIGPDALTPSEIKDLNRSRSYLQELARRHGTVCMPTVEEAIEAIARLMSQHFKNTSVIDRMTRYISFSNSEMSSIRRASQDKRASQQFPALLPTKTNTTAITPIKTSTKETTPTTIATRSATSTEPISAQITITNTTPTATTLTTPPWKTQVGKINTIVESDLSSESTRASGVNRFHIPPSPSSTTRKGVTTNQHAYHASARTTTQQKRDVEEEAQYPGHIHPEGSDPSDDDHDDTHMTRSIRQHQRTKSRSSLGPKKHHSRTMSQEDVISSFRGFPDSFHGELHSQKRSLPPLHDS